MKIAFTPQQIKGLKAKATDKRQEFRDSIGNNLFVVVQPKSGATSFVIRPIIDGKQRRITLGRFPVVGLADARKRSWEPQPARSAAASPIGTSKAVAVPEPSITVQEAWDLYWAIEGGKRKSASEK